MTSLNAMPGKAVVVTGSSRGIGLAIAKAFLSAGANVVLSGLNESETEATRNVLSDEYGQDRVKAVAGDVRNPDHAVALVEVG